MRISKAFSIITLFLLACQLICGVYLANTPGALAGGNNGFHLTVGILILVFSVATLISVFSAARKARS